MRHVDKDGSGEIGFNEFLAILQPREAAAGAGSEKSKMATANAVNKIVRLQQVKKVGRAPDSCPLRRDGASC